MNTPTLQIKRKTLGLTDYRHTWQAMKDFTHQRQAQTADEIWITQHPPVFTQGLNGKPEHLLSPGGIPVVQIDRGGQVTYHGPGQLLFYCLLDLHRYGIGVRGLVSRLEDSVIELLDAYAITAATRQGAPGVYVDDAKIAALGLRIRKGCCYHGLSLNIDMDLEPFGRINPCGYQGLAVTQLSNFDISASVDEVGNALADIFVRRLGERSG